MDKNKSHGNNMISSEPGVLYSGSQQVPFEHFLITRFNIPLNFSDKKFDAPTLRERIDLFERFCLPSVAAQTNKNFKWLVLFDQNSPDFLKEKVAGYQTLKNFIPIFGEQYSRYYIRKLIYEHVSCPIEYLITSRLDNDDAVCRDYIKIVQDQFDRRPMLAVNLVNGYCWNDQKVYYDRRKSNPFISLIEKVQHTAQDGFVSVYFKMHEEIQSAVPTRNLNIPPGWIMVVHGKNMANRSKGFRMPIQKLHEQFTLHSAVFGKSESMLLCCCQWPIEIMRLVYRRLSRKRRR